MLLAGTIILATERHVHLHHHVPFEHEHLHHHPEEHHRHGHDGEVEGGHSHLHLHEPWIMITRTLRTFITGMNDRVHKGNSLVSRSK